MKPENRRLKSPIRMLSCSRLKECSSNVGLSAEAILRFASSVSRLARVFFCFSFVLALASNSLFAQLPSLRHTFKLSWNRNPENDVVGYNIYIGAFPGEHFAVIPVGNVTNFIVRALPPLPTYYFSITAVNSAGLESEKSVEIHVGPRLAAAPDPGGIQVAVEGIPGMSYTVERSADLAQWLVLTNLTADSVGRVILKHSTSENTKEFFRAHEDDE